MKIYDKERIFGDTDYHLRAYVDPLGLDAPIVIAFEVNDNRGRPLAEVRLPLAQSLANSMGTSPDKIRYFEQGQDASLTQFHFRPYEQTIRPYADDLRRDEVANAERQGHLQPTTVTRYNVVPESVSPEIVEASVKEPLRVPETYLDRQNKELSAVRGPDKESIIDEAAQRMTKAHEAEQTWKNQHTLKIKNEPTL